MPRSVNRGVQDDEELDRIRKEQKRRRKEKAAKICQMIGLTVAEFILCLICFVLGFYYYYMIEAYRNESKIKHHPQSVRYILLPPAPLAISAAFLTITYVDLISWLSLRPITYFTWIMVGTAGFLLFMLYAGVILLTTNEIIAFVAIAFACITAIVFLADLICMLLSFKRFPVPHWILKRKHDKIDKCVCSGDYDPEDEPLERPICRCGDHWGEPCTCDDLTCGCQAEKKKDKTICDCCECATQVLLTKKRAIPAEPEEECPVVSTMSGQDFAEERNKSMLIQATMPMMNPNEICSKSPGPYCMDAPWQMSPRQSLDPYEARPQPSTMMSRSTLASRHTVQMSPSRLASPSMASRLGGRPSTMVKGLENPTMDMAARIGGPHMELTNTLGLPSMGLASQMALNKPQKAATPRAKSQMSYSVYTATVDNSDTLPESVASKFDRQNTSQVNKTSLRKSKICNVQMTSRSSTDDEIGEGDYSRKRLVMYNKEIVPSVTYERSGKKEKTRLKFSNYTSTEYLPTLEIENGYMSDPEAMQVPCRLTTLPGQVPTLDDDSPCPRPITKRNVSVSAREKSRRSSSSSRATAGRPKTTMDGLDAPRIIRNVSTTVRAMRTLSRVMEADNESRVPSRIDVNRESDRFPSECTITINKQ